MFSERSWGTLPAIQPSIKVNLQGKKGALNYLYMYSHRISLGVSLQLRNKAALSRPYTMKDLCVSLCGKAGLKYWQMQLEYTIRVEMVSPVQPCQPHNQTRQCNPASIASSNTWIIHIRFPSGDVPTGTSNPSTRFRKRSLFQCDTTLLKYTCKFGNAYICNCNRNRAFKRGRTIRSSMTARILFQRIRTARVTGAWLTTRVKGHSDWWLSTTSL